MEAAAEGTSGGERWPDGGEDTDELSGLCESDQSQPEGEETNIRSIIMGRKRRAVLGRSKNERSDPYTTVKM